MGNLPKIELKDSIHCPELETPPPPRVMARLAEGMCRILTTPLAGRKPSLWRGWLGRWLDRASGLTLQWFLEQRRECVRRDFRPSSGDRPRCLGSKKEIPEGLWKNGGEMAGQPACHLRMTEYNCAHVCMILSLGMLDYAYAIHPPFITHPLIHPFIHMPTHIPTDPPLIHSSTGPLTHHPSISSSISIYLFSILPSTHQSICVLLCPLTHHSPLPIHHPSLHPPIQWLIHIPTIHLSIT